MMPAAHQTAMLVFSSFKHDFSSGAVEKCCPLAAGAHRLVYVAEASNQINAVLTLRLRCKV